MILNIRDSGNMDSNLDKVDRLGRRLILLTLAVGKTGLSMEQVSKLGMMGHISMVIGYLMLLKGTVFISGLILEYTPVNGKTINYMEEESSIGLMVVHTSEITMTT